MRRSLSKSEPSVNLGMHDSAPRTAVVLSESPLQARDARSKDKEEIEEKRNEYRDYMQWKGRGIIYDLEQVHQVFHPTIHLLLPIALVMADALKVQIGRQEKRRKDLLIGWFNKHYESIHSYIPRLVIIDEKGDLKGPHQQYWRRFENAHPTEELVDCILKSFSE
jgi:hypothetical protein